LLFWRIFRRWRKITTSTTGLLGAIQVEVKMDGLDENVAELFDFLQTWLPRSANFNLSFSLELKFSIYPGRYAISAAL
jgi:hypothetical protein